MEFYFSYTLKFGNTVLRIGKTYASEKTKEAVVAKLHKRYNYFDWTRVEFSWHISEAAALKTESFKMFFYQQTHQGNLPPYNERRAGGGRQRYLTCKAIQLNNSFCPNGALKGNYGYCGIHR